MRNSLGRMGSVLNMSTRNSGAEDTERDRDWQSSLSGDQVRALNYHWSRAGPSEYACYKSVHYALLAADLALSSAAPLEARRLLEGALERAEPFESLLQHRAGRIHCLLGQANVSLGHLDDARTHLTKSLAILDPAASATLNSKQLRAGLKRLRRLEITWQMPRVETMLRSSAGEEEDGVPLELAMAYELLAQIALGEQRHQLAEYLALSAAQNGMRLRSLQPVVPRAYALLFTTGAAHGSGITARWRTARYARRYNLASSSLPGSGGQTFELLDMYVASAEKSHPRRRGLLPSIQFRGTSRDGKGAAIERKLKDEVRI